MRKSSGEALAAAAIELLATLRRAARRQFVHLAGHVGEKAGQGARLLEFGLERTEFGAQFGPLFTAMTSHPELVSGAGRGDLALMQTAPGDWVAKAGAEGVQTMGIRSAGLGIAIKVEDGNARALLPVMVSVLQQLGLLTNVQTSPLAKWTRPTLYNARDKAVGEIRSIVELKSL